MKTVAIVQARMSSTRLPGKVLMHLGSRTVLGCVIQRLRQAKLIDQIVVATTVSSVDDAVVNETERLDVDCFRGPEQDVLDRYYQAAKEFAAKTVVRITSDCPLIDPALVDATSETFFSQRADYATNAEPHTFPRGLDVEVVTIAALQRAYIQAHKPYEREHVTPYFYENPQFFRLASFTGAHDYSGHRWTLDTPEDMHLLRELYARLENQGQFHWQDVLALVEADPA